MAKLYCSNCGQNIDIKSLYCTYCGAPQHGPESAAYRATQPQIDNPNNYPKDSASFFKHVPRRHLSPNVIGVMIFDYIKKTLILIPLFAVGIYMESWVAAIFLLYLLGIFIIAQINFNNYFFLIDEDGLTVDFGFIHKKQVTVPFEQIQNVNIESSFIDRIFAIARISIETSGNSSQTKENNGGSQVVRPEAQIPGVSLQDAKEIHDILIDGADLAKSSKQ